MLLRCRRRADAAPGVGRDRGGSPPAQHGCRPNSSRDYAFGRVDTRAQPPSNAPLPAMGSRLDALQALYERGHGVDDASVDQSVTTYPPTDAALGLDLTLDSEPAEVSLVDEALPTDEAPSLRAERDEDWARASMRAEVEPDNAPPAPAPAEHKEPSDAGDGDTRATPAEETTPRKRLEPKPRPSVASSSYATPGRSVSYDTSASASLQASELRHGALELLDDPNDTHDASASNWGVQEMQRRTAAGISIKSTQQKIEQLTAERDDLKIEVDFHRRNMSPDDVGAEVIALRQEKLAYVRRLQQMSELLKSQDNALKTVNREVKTWEAKLADYEALHERMLAAEERARRAERAEPPGGARREAALRRAEDACAAAERERDGLERTLAERDVRGVKDERGELAALREENAALREELATAQDAVSVPDDAALQQQLDEQHETICALQDELAAERLVVAEKEGEIDRFEAGVEAAESAAAAAQEQLEHYALRETAAQNAVARLEADVARLAAELHDAHTYHEGLVDAQREKLAAVSRELSDARAAASDARIEADHARADADDLRAELGDAHADLERHMSRCADLESLNARLNDKLVALVRDLKDEETARERADTDWSQRYDSSEAHTRRQLAAKEAQIETLTAQADAARDAQRAAEQAHAALQRRLQTAEVSARDSLERTRAAAALESERLADELAHKVDAWHETQDELARLRAEARELTHTLQAETRTRLGAQERLTATQRALDEARAELERKPTSSLSSRAADASSLRARDAPSKAQLAERNALLATAYEGIARALAEEGGSAAADGRLAATHFHLFHERLTLRLRRLAGLQSTFTTRAHALEKDYTERLAYVCHGSTDAVTCAASRTRGGRRSSASSARFVRLPRSRRSGGGASWSAKTSSRCCAARMLPSSSGCSACATATQVHCCRPRASASSSGGARRLRSAHSASVRALMSAPRATRSASGASRRRMRVR